MARTALVVKTNRRLKKREQARANGEKEKFSTRTYHRCRLCGRTGSYMKMFQLCRICFREQAQNGKIMGVKKSSW